MSIETDDSGAPTMDTIQRATYDGDSSALAAMMAYYRGEAGFWKGRAVEAGRTIDLLREVIAALQAPKPPATRG